METNQGVDAGANLLEVFRDALVWSPAEQVAKVDMDKARQIHRDNLRKLRAPLFVANDLHLRDALIDGNTERRNACLRQRDALREVTALVLISAARTLEELHAAIPKVLVG